MSSLPPENRPSRRREEEVIAAIVALLGLGGVAVAAIAQSSGGMNLDSLRSWIGGQPEASVSPQTPPAASGMTSLSAPISPAPTSSAPISPAPTSSAPTSSAPVVAAVPKDQTSPAVPSPSGEISPRVAASPAPAPTIAATPQSPMPSVTGSPIQFSDVPGDFWAGAYIQQLSARGILTGLPDGTFQPDRPVTRAELAVVIQKTFERSEQQTAIAFKDVPADHWAAPAITKTVRINFMRGYPGEIFRPSQNVSRLEVWLSLAKGLNLAVPENPQVVVQQYQDRASIPPWAWASVAATTTTGLVVNYPDVRTLNPNRPATRAEVTAIVYQALVLNQQAAAIQSPYLVQGKQ